MDLVIPFLFACGFLLIGFVLRVVVGWLRRLYIPAAVIGGIVGFALVQAAIRQDAWPALGAFTANTASALSRWPGVLIAFVFAGLLLERSGKRFGEAVKQAARQGIVVWIIVLGEAAVGLLVTWLLILPFYDVPASFGQLIETGFAGGHGTAAAMGAVWANALEFPEGRDLAFFFATVGLVYGVVSGIVFVNLGVRRGWLRGGGGGAREPVPVLPADAGRPRVITYAGAGTIPVITGLEDRHDPKPVAFGRVRGEVIDPFVFQILIVAAAFAVGFGLQLAFVAIVDLFASDRAMDFVGNIPLFLFTLVGGWLVREAMHAIGVGDLIDGASVKRIVAIAMEFLIVAAMATLRIEALATYWVPVTLLLVAGCAWVAFCLLFVSPRLLPRPYWFELAMINYGMSTATTAQGMMLLRIVDRDLETGAAEDYAVAAPMSAPFIGGGIITVTLPLLLLRVHVGIVVAAFAVVLVVLYVLGRQLALAAAPRERITQAAPAEASS